MLWHSAETTFCLSAKRTSPFKSAGASVQSTTGSRGVRISGSNAGYTMFQRGVKGTGYSLHSPVSPSLPCPASPCAVTFQLDSCCWAVTHPASGCDTFMWLGRWRNKDDESVTLAASVPMDKLSRHRWLEGVGMEEDMFVTSELRVSWQTTGMSVGWYCSGSSALWRVWKQTKP